MDNLEEMDEFLEKYNFPKLRPEKIQNLIRPITSTEIEANQKSSNKQKTKSIKNNKFKCKRNKRDHSKKSAKLKACSSKR